MRKDKKGTRKDDREQEKIKVNNKSQQIMRKDN